MPVLSGHAATRVIRSMGYTGLLCGLTGNALQEEQQVFLNAGADCVFTKPFRESNMDTLMGFIETHGCESTPVSRHAIRSLMHQGLV
jgi:CheY-like chemotaxis protein